MVPGSTVALPTTGSAPSASAADVCPDGGLPAYGALELGSGDLIWAACSNDELYREILGFDGEVLLALERTGETAHAVGMDAITGAELWRTPVHSYSEIPSSCGKGSWARLDR